MATNGSTRPQLSMAPPPRTLNVQKFAESRALELKSLHTIIADRLNNDFRSQRKKRRRTTGYESKVSKKRTNKRHMSGVEVCKSSELNLGKEQKRPPRRVRRRDELKKNPERGFCITGDGTKRLRTHVWHAKRFTMTKLWGFHLPLGLHGRGRGSRAILKRFKREVLVHDASYHCAIQLEGPENLLSSVLNMVLMPSPSTCSEDAFRHVLSGDRYGTAMLHHAGLHVSQAIAPVIYMWRKFQQNLAIDGGTPPCCNEHKQLHRILWVWLHPSALNEGLDALKFACEKQVAETGSSINCISLEGQLAKLELVGLKSVQLLEKILCPVTCFSENFWQLRRPPDSGADSMCQIEASSIHQKEDCLYSHAVISLLVNDPRTLPIKKTAGNEAKENGTLIDSANQNEELKHDGRCILSDSQDLWDAFDKISPPVNENVLCTEKHSQRLALFGLGNANLGGLDTSNEGKCSRSCPILLMKNDNANGSFLGWSIILPLSWVKAFWIPLVSMGAHALGLREKHWIACEVGLPYFPADFPDCNAYSFLKATEAALSNKKAGLCPSESRPSRIPIPPPWDCIDFSLRKGFPEALGSLSPQKEDVRMENMTGSILLKIPDSGECSATSPYHVVPFEGFVARTSQMLCQFLSRIHGDHLLLFPGNGDRKIRFDARVKDERTRVFSQSQNAFSQLERERKPCFLRVILHAYRKGAFEEGAIVCAPRPTDLSIQNTEWQANNGGDLQIPQSSVSSYFKEQSPDKWVLQIPPADEETHRWPVGFVTTGFIRGSKKPAAEAFCEATCLARLREEQWRVKPANRRKEEIYLLVRNLRSTAYRLALATIVLEQEEEDVEFL